MEVPGSGVAVPSVLEWEIPVEHPGAGHELGVYLNSDRNVETPADVRVQLGDSLGRVLIDDERTLEPRCDGKSWDCTWDGYSREFTPPADGELRLTVTLLTPDVAHRPRVAGATRRRPTGSASPATDDHRRRSGPHRHAPARGSHPGRFSRHPAQQVRRSEEGV